MANVLKPEKQEQVRALGRLAWSLRRIQAETGMHRESVRRYLTEAGIAIREQRGRRRPAVDGQRRASQVTADPAGSSEHLTSAAKSACEPRRDRIATALDQGRNGKAIWQELVDRHGLGGSYESVKSSYGLGAGRRRPFPDRDARGIMQRWRTCDPRSRRLLVRIGDRPAGARTRPIVREPRP